MKARWQVGGRQSLTVPSAAVLPRTKPALAARAPRGFSPRQCSKLKKERWWEMQTQCQIPPTILWPVTNGTHEIHSQGPPTYRHCPCALEGLRSAVHGPRPAPRPCARARWAQLHRTGCWGRLASAHSAEQFHLVSSLDLGLRSKRASSQCPPD